MTVHRKNCPNIAKEQERLIDVYWRKDLDSATYPVDVQLKATDRPSLLVDVMGALSMNKVNTNNLHAHLINGNLDCNMSMTLFISDAKRLEDVFSVLRSIKGVYEVSRVIH